MRVVCDADDTYVSGAPETLYEAFALLRSDAEARCDLKSTNLDKTSIKAGVCPAGGVEGIPAWILEAQGGGELLGIKCVGTFVAPHTQAADDWRRREEHGRAATAATGGTRGPRGTRVPRRESSRPCWTAWRPERRARARAARATRRPGR